MTGPPPETFSLEPVAALRASSSPASCPRPAKHVNNFDLIRLFAALQVVLIHAASLLHVVHSTPRGDALMSIVFIFPGVPIFFCISGFLIARSVERNLDDLRVYFRSRALRIYPALWLCVLIGGVTLWKLGYFHNVSTPRVAEWWVLNLFAGGASINPDYLRSFGPGVWNGALWTIFVELSFYVVLPIIYLVCRRLRLSVDLVLGILLVASFMTFIAAKGLIFGQTKQVGAFQKIVWFSLAGNLWMFLFGVLAHRFWPRLSPLLKGKFLYWLAALLFIYGICYYWIPFVPNGVVFGSMRLFIWRSLLAAVTLSAAYTGTSLGSRLLRGNDFSYGIYLFHSFMFGLFLYFGVTGLKAFVPAFLIASALAVFSWFCIERRALALK